MAIILGTDWHDRLYGDVYGYAEDDDIFGYAGNDVIDGGFGDDWLYGGSGNDWLYGDSGEDVLYGEAGNDRLYGEAGHDDLYGGSGRDSLFGGTGEDWLSGGSGGDYLSGGSASDTFFFAKGTSGITTATADVVADWNGAYDWVDTNVAGTYSNYREAGTTATSIESAAYLAETRFTSTSISHVFLYNASTDTGYLVSDLNNDDRFETGVVIRNAGYASDFSYFDIV